MVRCRRDFRNLRGAAVHTVIDRRETIEHELARTGDRPRTSALDARRLAHWALTSQLLFTATWVVAGFAERRYSHFDQTISDLAAQDGNHPWLVMSGFLVYGSGLIALGLALRRSVGVHAARKVGPTLLCLAGALMPVVALARLDCSTSGAACRARVAAEIESGQQSVHNLVSLLVFILLIVAPLVWSRRFRADGWRDLRAASIVAGLAGFALLVVAIGIDGSRHWSGLAQRLFLAVPTAWICIVALRASRLGHRDSCSVPSTKES